jgi:hypothetical protein
MGGAEKGGNLRDHPLEVERRSSLGGRVGDDPEPGRTLVERWSQRHILTRQPALDLPSMPPWWSWSPIRRRAATGWSHRTEMPFAFDAPYLGSVPGLPLNVTNVVGKAATSDDNRCYLVEFDGGVSPSGTPNSAAGWAASLSISRS